MTTDGELPEISETAQDVLVNLYALGLVAENGEVGEEVLVDFLADKYTEQEVIDALNELESVGAAERD